jgi:signal transduction histidine kinase
MKSAQFSKNNTSMSAVQHPESFFRELEIEFLVHELKDPLAIIETGMRSLLEKPEKYGILSSRQEKTLRRSLRNTRKVRDMVNGLLEIGRSEAGRFVCRRFDPVSTVYGVICEALEILGMSGPEAGKADHNMEALQRECAAQQIFVTIEPAVERMELWQDEVKFRQIVGNLLKNAMFHRRDRIDLRLAVNQEYLYVEIADDGPGIEPEHHDVIFQRYARVDETPSSRKGHGLGLAGALILARSLGGDITVTSLKGQGATFRVLLPLQLNRSQHGQ